MDTLWMCCRGFAAKSRLYGYLEIWCRPGALPGHFQARRDLDGTGLGGTGRDGIQSNEYLLSASPISEWTINQGEENRPMTKEGTG
jgi:hypothetical protein